MIASLLFLLCSTGSKTGETLFAAGDYKNALEEYKKQTEKDPSDWNAFLKLGDCYRALKEYDNAVKNYKKALEAYPNWEPPQTRITETRIEQADFFISQKKLRSAEEVYKALTKDFPDNKQYYEKLAELQKQMGKIDNSLETLRALQSRFGSDEMIMNEISSLEEVNITARAYFTEGNQMSQARNYEGAIEKFSKALELKPDYHDAKYNLYIAKGRLAIRRGKSNLYWQALLDLGEAMALKPESAEPHYFMAIVYEKKNIEDYDTPIAEYQKALELEPGGQFAEECKKKIKEISDRKEKMRKFWGK